MVLPGAINGVLGLTDETTECCGKPKKLHPHFAGTDIVTDTDFTAKSILKFQRLDWDENVLSFYRFE